MPQIAVLVAAYNAERWLSQCLDSLLGQTLHEVEILCIDDCSTDGTAAIIDDYARRDSRVKALRTEHNSGQAVARNLALESVTAPYVCMVDADDWLSPDALASAVDIFSHYPATDCVVFRLIKAYADDVSTGCREAQHPESSETVRTEDYGLPEPLAHDGVLSGLEAARLSLDGFRLHGLYVTRTELHRRYPFDTATRLYSDDNATHLHYLHSREVRACSGRYFYRQHPSLTQAFNPLHFAMLEANLSLRRTLLREGVPNDILRTYESHRWLNFVILYRTLLKHRDELSADLLADLTRRFTATLATFSHSTLPLRACWKPGYWLFPRLATFDLQQRAYLQYKLRHDPAYIDACLA